jgi:hypothetical protein
MVSLLLVSLTSAAVPPADSPAARGEHPRLFLTATGLQALRNHITTAYKNEFQSFVAELDAKFQDPASGKLRWEKRWGGINYAFLGLLDPKNTMSSFISGHTQAEYCRKAVEYARILLPDISANVEEYHGNLNTATNGPIHLPPMVVYDWCHGQLSAVDKLDFVNAFINSYQQRQAPKRLLIDNQQTMKFHDALPILAFYRDAFTGSYAGKTYAQWQSAMYDWFEDIWISQYVDTINYFYSAAGWHEGPAYGMNAYVNTIFAVGAMRTALNTDYFANLPYFRTYPLFVLANTKPLPEAGKYYLNRWGAVGGGKAEFPCQSIHLAMGTLKSVAPEYASLQKWQWQQVPECASYPKYGGQWGNAVFYTFLWGHKEVLAKTPAATDIGLAQRLGQGEFVFRTGYDKTSDTMIALWATDYVILPGGHAQHHFGHFTLEKFGTLILKAGNGKSPGTETIANDDGALFHNVIGVHDPANPKDTYMDYDKRDAGIGNERYTSPHYQPGGANHKGTIVAADINNGRKYEYVSYDSSLAWLNKVNLSQRELVYLRGSTNNEFIVLLDRMRTLSPSYEKKWHIWIPSQPVFLNGDPRLEREGKWTSTNTDTMMVTNSYTDNNSHGRMFVKSLFPSSVRTYAIGGPKDHYFENTKGVPVAPENPSSMVYPLSAEQENRIGWGRIEIQPTVTQNDDVFLEVIQFGDANTLSAMSPTLKIDSSDGKMLGAHIKNSSNQWIVMFAKQATDVSTIRAVTYAFEPITSSSEHLLVNMQPSATYHITLSAGAGLTTITVSTTPRSGSAVATSNAEGVLRFSLDGQNSIPPAAPQNFRVQQ